MPKDCPLQWQRQQSWAWEADADDGRDSGHCVNHSSLSLSVTHVVLLGQDRDS